MPWALSVFPPKRGASGAVSIPSQKRCLGRCQYSLPKEVPRALSVFPPKRGASGAVSIPSQKRCLGRCQYSLPKEVPRALSVFPPKSGASGAVSIPSQKRCLRRLVINQASLRRVRAWREWFPRGLRNVSLGCEMWMLGLLGTRARQPQPTTVSRDMTNRPDPCCWYHSQLKCAPWTGSSLLSQPS